MSDLQLNFRDISDTEEDDEEQYHVENDDKVTARDESTVCFSTAKVGRDQSKKESSSLEKINQFFITGEAGIEALPQIFGMVDVKKHDVKQIWLNTNAYLKNLYTENLHLKSGKDSSVDIDIVVSMIPPMFDMLSMMFNDQPGNKKRKRLLEELEKVRNSKKKKQNKKYSAAFIGVIRDFLKRKTEKEGSIKCETLLEELKKSGSRYSEWQEDDIGSHPLFNTDWRTQEGKKCRAAFRELMENVFEISSDKRTASTWYFKGLQLKD